MHYAWVHLKIHFALQVGWVLAFLVDAFIIEKSANEIINA